ncbi:MAG: Hsp70 family protein [Myxococcales bacterium]|nr:Hsp70 family protein [Myxococcales bacterium]
MAGAVVGIDLGTTNTVVAVVRGGKAVVLADEEGHRLLPSVVSFHPSGEVLVGHKARERRLVDARNTVYSIKRLIGRSWQSDEVERARQRFPFELREGPTHGPLVVARGETYTLPEISAFVLRRAKAIAEAALGEPVERAVVTVPASFNDLQRASTKVAAREAGLEVLRILNEPTAAALAYGFGKSGNERIAVYDFGGGTFDLTLLDLSGNVFEVIATAGDSFLGGDDVDQLIADRIALDVIQQTRFDPRSDVQVMERLRAAAEQVKIALSQQNDMSVELKELGYGPGGRPIDITFVMSRAQLEQIAMPLVDRSFRVCDDALQLARLKHDAFDNVILVGGSTRIPLVRRRVEQAFSKKPMDRVNPDEVVAIGAAIQAAALTGAERRRQQTPAPVLDPNAVKASRIQTLGGVGKTPRGTGPQTPPPPPREGGVARTTGRNLAPPLRDSRPPAPAGGYPNIPGSVTPHPSRPGNTAPLVPASQPLDRNTGRLVAPPMEEPPPSHAHAPPGFEMPPPGFEMPRGFPDHSPEPMRLENLRPADFTPPPVAAAPAAPIRTPIPTPMDVGPELEPDYYREPAPAERPRTQLGMAAFPQGGSAKSTPPPVNMAELAPPPRKPLAQTQIAQAPEPQAPPPAKSLAQTQIAQSQPLASPPARPPAHAANLPGLPGPHASAPHAAPHGAPAMRAPSAPPSRAEDPLGGIAAPLLIDVTPLSLAVETVGGYVDRVIARNTPVPCAQTRTFTTSSDNQQVVMIRVCQGEGEQFPLNTSLGQLELSGLRPARRGDLAIEVTFELDADGILNVRARDTETQRQTQAKMKLVGL